MATLSNTSFFSPTQISGCALWLDAADQSSVVLSGGNVSVWRDKTSAYAGTAVPTTTIQYVSNTLNGLPVIRIATAAYFTFGNINDISTQEFNIFAVARATGSIGNIGAIIGKGSGINGWWFGYNPPSYLQTQSGTGNTLLNNTIVVVSGLTNYNVLSSMNPRTSGTTQYLNGTSVGTGGSTTLSISNASDLRVGSQSSGFTLTNTDLAEVILYRGPMTVAQRQQIEGYLAWKWGLQSNLPSSHPFYNYNPSVPNINLFTPTTVITSPLQVSGCSLWLDAGDTTSITQSAGAVSRWNDKSGNGRHMSQGVASNQPTILSNARNSLPVIVLNTPTTNYMSTITTIPVNGLTGMSIFAVANAPANFGIGDTTANALIWWPEIGGWGQVGVTFTQTAYGWRFGTGQGANNPRVNFPTNIGTSYVMTNVIKSGVTETPYYNGNNLGAVTVSNTAIANTGTTAFIGIGQNSNLGRYNVGEIVVYLRALSTSEQQQVEGYLAWKWGLQSSLPTTHPFYNFNPSAPLLIQLAALPIVQSNTTLTTMSPTQISGCALWLDAADSNSFGLTGGSNITSWNDKSGNVRNFSLVGSTNPVLIPNIQNGQSVVTFNGTNQVLSNTNFVFPNSAYTVFSLHLLRSTVGNSSGFQRVIQTDVRFFMGVNSVSVAVFTGTAAGSWNDIAALTPNFNNSNQWALLSTYSAPSGSSNVLSNFINGTQYNTKNGTTSAFTGLTIGGLFNSQWWNGYVSEIIIYDSVLPTAQRQQIEGYLSWKWGTQSNLPANHPYYYNPLIPNLVLQSQLLSITPPSFSPLRFSGTSLWLDAADRTSVITSGNLVTRWNDKSGNLNHATTVSNLYPTYNSSSSIVNLPTIRFTATNWSNNTITGLTPMSLPNFQTTFDVSLFYISIPYTNIGMKPIFILKQTGTQTFIDSQTNVVGINLTSPSFSFSISAPLVLNTPCINTAIYSSSLSNFNGGQNGSNTSVSVGASVFSTATPRSISLGAYYDTTSTTFQNSAFNGEFLEIICYNAALSTNQRQQIEGYLAWKWGLQSSLPANHPYKLFPPS